MISVDMRDRKPIYEQLIDNIRALSVQGILAPDEQLPSVRQLAAELAINPNTIQKAYTELERQGVIYSLPGRGNFVSSDQGSLAEQERKRIADEIRQALRAAKQAGMTRDAALALVGEIFGTEEDKKEEETKV